MEMRLFQLLIAGLFFSGLVCILPGCGTLYEQKSDVPNFPDEVTSTIAIGDTRQKVHSSLGEPLVDAPDHGLEVYRRSGSDFAVGWIIAPWVPLPIWSDKTVVVVLILYDDQEIVRDISVGTWEQTRHRFETKAVNADGFTFINMSHKEPATLLSPPISSKGLVASKKDKGTCSLILVGGNCPMEKILLNGHLIADFPYAGFDCSIEDSAYQARRHILKGNLLWKRIESGNNKINIRQRMFMGNFEKTFECKPGEIVYARLIGRKWHREPWTFHHLEGDIHITKDDPDNPTEYDGARFILWHSGTWFGMPNMTYDQ